MSTGLVSTMPDAEPGAAVEPRAVVEPRRPCAVDIAGPSPVEAAAAIPLSRQATEGGPGRRLAPPVSWTFG